MESLKENIHLRNATFLYSSNCSSSSRRLVIVQMAKAVANVSKAAIWCCVSPRPFNYYFILSFNYSIRYEYWLLQLCNQIKLLLLLIFNLFFMFCSSVRFICMFYNFFINVYFFGSQMDHLKQWNGSLDDPRFLGWRPLYLIILLIFPSVSVSKFIS